MNKEHTPENITSHSNHMEPEIREFSDGSLGYFYNIQQLEWAGWKRFHERLDRNLKAYKKESEEFDFCKQERYCHSKINKLEEQLDSEID